MDRESMRLVVRTTLILLARLAQRTRTPADDLLVTMLQAKEDQLVDAVMHLKNNSNATPTEEQIVEALKSVGIKV
jgi:hypothetical protein